MEVHHGGHHAKKNFREYFLEFLMIFLAVTVGFFAERYREYLNDRSKEKEYMVSLLLDLKRDSNFLQLCIHDLIPYHSGWIDSTERLLQVPFVKGKDREIYQAFVIASSWTYDFHPTQRTLSELHNEGFHLIRDEEAAKSISFLEGQYHLFAAANDFVQNMQNDLDVSAYIFADQGIMAKMFAVAFKNPVAVKLQLSDIPVAAKVKPMTDESLKVFTDKLSKYNYYLLTSVKADYTILLNQIILTMASIEKQYEL